MCSKTTIATKLAQDDPEEQGSTLYRKNISRYAKVIRRTSSRRFPKARTWDHAIDLKPDAKPYAGKAYRWTITRRSAQNVHFRELWDKGYIRPSLLLAAPFSLSGRKTANYVLSGLSHKTNKRSEQKYPLPLIPELIDNSKEPRFLLNSIYDGVYNNVRIKKRIDSKRRSWPMGNYGNQPSCSSESKNSRQRFSP